MRPTTIGPRVAPLLALLVAGTLAASCGVVDSGRVEPINAGELDDTLPSTTTSTTAPPTTAAVTTTTVGFETTTTVVQTETVRMYFIASGQLTYVERQLASPVSLPQVIAALKEGPPPGELGTGLRSAVPSTAFIVAHTDGSGVADIGLPDNFFAGIPVGDQRLVTAQIALTVIDSGSRIGQVRFDTAVPNALGEQIPAGQTLSFRDFAELLEGGTAATTTSTSQPPP